MKSFETVSGPKVDKWLVKSVGFLVLSSGLIFLYTGLINPIVPLEIPMLGILNALSLLAIDLHYVRKGIIQRIYLADAFCELALLISYYLQWP